MAFKLNECILRQLKVCRVGFCYSLIHGLIQLSYTQDPAMPEAILDITQIDGAQPKAMKSGCLNISASIVDTSFYQC